MNAETEAVLAWEEPPDSNRGRGRFDVEAILEDLSKNPGNWAVITEGVSQSYAHSSTLVKQLRDKGVEVEGHKVGQKIRIYARFDPSQRRGRRAA